MNQDDIIYVILLLASVAFSALYRYIEPDNRKRVGFVVGLFLSAVVSKYHLVHLVFSVFASACIILCLNKRICHVVAFFSMFSYLLFVRLYIQITGPSNMIQMILTLKCVGLAMEVNTASRKKENLSECDKELMNLGFLDVFFYAFNYVGLLTGPYYSFRTYSDYFRLPFSQKANVVKATIDTIKYVPLYMAIYLGASYIWPLDYAKSDEFYTQRSVMYRLWYIFPTFLIFRYRMYSGLTLSECVCTMAGFGAYPKEIEVRSGAGPTKDNYDDIKSEEYDFGTIRNMDVKGTEFGLTFRDGMKTWNMCVQYWMAVNVYKRFPSKQLRTLATLAASAVWHGIHPGYYFCICGAPFYLPVEDLWNKLARTDATGVTRLALDVIFVVSKWFAFSYMGTAFLLLSIDKIWHFYSSVYHIPYILWAVLYVTGFAILKMKPKKLSSVERQSGKEAIKVE